MLPAAMNTTMKTEIPIMPLPSLPHVSPVTLPIPAPIVSSDNIPLSRAADKARRKGRKRQYVTEEEKQEAVTKRSERNKYFARENRKKKKEYIESLEGRIEVLTLELTQCKKRLSEYEARIFHANFAEHYQQIKADTLRFEEQRLLHLTAVAHSAANDFASVRPILKSAADGKNKMLDQLAESLLEFSIPSPYQYLIRVAETRGKGEKATGVLEEQILKDTTALLDQVPEEASKFVQGIAGHLRENVGRYYASLEGIKGLVNEFDFYVMERLVPRLGKEHVARTMKWVHELMDHRTLEQLRLLGRGLVTLAVVKWNVAANAPAQKF